MEVVTGVRRFLHAVLVVDDASIDRTAACALEGGASVLRHDRTLGKGAALNTGWRYALQQGFAWALNLDGDGQHAPADIAQFLDCTRATGADLVVGQRSRQLMPRVRRLVNTYMSYRLSRLAGMPLPDTQCGFRLMNLQAWSSLELLATHFEVESDVLLEFVAAGYQVEFVPVQTIYKDERSKIHPFHDTVRWFRWLRSAKGRSRGAVRPRFAPVNRPAICSALSGEAEQQGKS